MKSFAREEKRFIMEVQMETGNYNRISDQVNREYKDRLFCKVFERKEDLLELYNAVNGTRCV